MQMLGEAIDKLKLQKTAEKAEEMPFSIFVLDQIKSSGKTSDGWKSHAEEHNS